MYKIHDLLNSCLINDFLKVFVNLFFVLPWVFFTYAKKKKCMMYQHRICFQLNDFQLKITSQTCESISHAKSRLNPETYKAC